MMDKARFEMARQALIEGNSIPKGIGTLGEKILHATVKLYMEPDPAMHEKKLGFYVADIHCGEHIYEIQTRQFNKLRAKLAAFLPDHKVTVVYPMPARKWLLWIDPADGQVSKPRLSPKRGNIYDAFYELYRIKPMLKHPNLSLLIMLIDLEEYRLLNGWSEDGKKGSSRYDRLPLSLEHELLIGGPGDYSMLLPEGLPLEFTSSDFAKSAEISHRHAQTAMNVLSFLGVVDACGKKGRLCLYKRSGLSANGA
jgi:hypothetical protein